VLVDGLPCPELGCEHEAIIDGDARCHSIAAASVIAKVLRDLLMDRLAARHPGYCWDTNKGYATPDHLDAIQRLGPTRHHRYSFEPVAQIELLAVTAAT
jgi:ribonuclease HII